MTEKLYLVNSYMKECESKVTRAEGKEVVLDRTVFYPAGGGQPSDVGTIKAGGEVYSVVDARKEGNDVVHVLDREAGGLAGRLVLCNIDWDRRYSLMRYHTAVHLIDAVFVNRYSGGQITGGQLYTDRARFDVDLDGFDRDTAARLIQESTLLGQEGHEVRAYALQREEAVKIAMLARTAPGRELLEKLDEVRVVEIVGVDMQADGGLHVRDTREIGIISLLKYTNNGRRHKRLEIKLS